MEIPAKGMAFFCPNQRWISFFQVERGNLGLSENSINFSGWLHTSPWKLLFLELRLLQTYSNIIWLVFNIIHTIIPNMIGISPLIITMNTSYIYILVYILYFNFGIILYFIILYYIILNYIMLYYVMLYYIMIYYTILYYIILYMFKLYYIILYYIILCF
jgi:hypothetical protein